MHKIKQAKIIRGGTKHIDFMLIDIASIVITFFISYPTEYLAR